MSGALEFEVFSIFPDAIRAFVETGLLGKAVARGLVRVHYNDLRSFSDDRHARVDDAPFGGGAGMVVRAEPVVAALEHAARERGPMHRLLLSPSGQRFDQRAAERLAGCARIGLLCGRYEGIDDRVREGWIDEVFSIGDFVLNGGEVAAAAIIEAVARLREGVIGNPDSITHESFASDPFGTVLEHPHYTRPARFRELDVPAVLLEGDHAQVEKWRRRMACQRTWMVRPDLRARPQLSTTEQPLIVAAPIDRASWLESVPTGVTSVVVGDARMRDLKQMRRWVTRVHRRAPWVLGMTSPCAGQPAREPAMVLDVLGYSLRSPPGPIVLWLGDAPELSVDAWLALASDESAPLPELAIGSHLIDISRPLTAGSPSLSLVRVALERLRTLYDPLGSGEPESSP